MIYMGNVFSIREPAHEERFYKGNKLACVRPQIRYGDNVGFRESARIGHLRPSIV